MKKVKFYVVKLLKGLEIDRTELGTALQDERGIISSRTYDHFKRLALKLQHEWNTNRPGNKHYDFKITNEFDEVDTFGGYPAYGFLPLGVQFKRKEDEK